LKTILRLDRIVTAFAASDALSYQTELVYITR